MHLDETPLFAPLPGQGGVAVSIRLDEVELRHLKVLRLQQRDTLDLVDGKGGTVRGEVLDPKRGEIVLTEPVRRTPRPSGPSLAVAVLKGGDLEDVFDHASQLPLNCFTPIWTSYTQHSRKPEVIEGMLRRLRLKARTALKQSRQLWCVEVHPPEFLEDWLKKIDETIWLLDEQGVPASQLPHTPSPWILSGPEGGFSPAELELISAHHRTLSLSLGTTRIRARTAPLLALGGWISR